MKTLYNFCLVPLGAAEFPMQEALPRSLWKLFSHFSEPGKTPKGGGGGWIFQLGARNGMASGFAAWGPPGRFPYCNF